MTPASGHPHPSARRPPAGSVPGATAAATSYDAIPYQSVAFAQTHPDRLATIARLFGLTPPDIACCRVLELGCASGGNLIPMAFALPGSEFVGIDLSQRQVDDAQAAIAGLELSNVRIERASILDVDDSWGQFDYLLCHGVFSWVDAAVQDKILQIAGTSLSPHGVAYVSYNTYPGWHMREMVRHMMRYHAGQFAEPPEQIEQARALLSFLATASQGHGAYGELLRNEAERLGHAPDSYLFHEHLEQTNTPLYFHQFAERAERAGLLYLSEATVSDMLTSHFPPDVAETLERISPDLLHLEQYMDFVRNRQFRQTLLVHADQHPRRSLTTGFLERLLVSSAATAEGSAVDLSADETVVFTNGRQRATVTLTATKAALSLLAERWPEAMAVDELCALALGRASASLDAESVAAAKQGLLGDLFGCVMYGMVTLHTQAPLCTSRPSERPLGYGVARYQSGFSSEVVNAHHQMVDLGRFGAEVLFLCDGTRHRRDIVDLLMTRFLNGEMLLEHEGRSVSTADAAQELLAQRVEAALQFLTRTAVLSG